MYKIAVLGDYNSIYGFAALGLDTFPVEDPAEGKEKLNRLAAGEYAVIYITEQLAAQLSAEISKYSEELMPAIIQIPGISRKYRCRYRKCKEIRGDGSWLRYSFQ